MMIKFFCRFKFC